MVPESVRLPPSTVSPPEVLPKVLLPDKVSVPVWPLFTVSALVAPLMTPETVPLSPVVSLIVPPPVSVMPWVIGCVVALANCSVPPLSAMPLVSAMLVSSVMLRVSPEPIVVEPV